MTFPNVLAAPVLALALPVSPAAAHPHVFGDARMDVLVRSDGTLKGVRNLWTMDVLFSSSVILEFDVDRDGRLTSGELERIGATVRDSIAQWDYFTEVQSGGRKVTLAAPDRIDAAVEENGRLTLSFEMAADERVPLAEEAVTVFNWDRSLYVSFRFEDAASVTVVDPPGVCTKRIVPPGEATREPAAWERPDPSPDAGTPPPEDMADYALLLATRVEVSCKGTGG